MALMKSVSGIRGIFGSDLTPINLATFTAAYGHYIGKGTVVVGRDSRVSGPICEAIIASTLQSQGIHVILVGIVPTPTVAMAVLNHKAQGGIIISASHNPGEWNALKLLNEKSEFLDAEAGQKVLALADNPESIAFVDAFSTGTLTTDNSAVEAHLKAILALPYIDKDKISAAKFKVGIDAVNGAGAVAMRPLLEQLGCEVHAIYEEPNGLFPHNPEPLKEHLGDICELVKTQKLDIGFVVDPDADRLAVVGSNGELWGEEYTQAAAFDFYLAKHKTDIATNLSSSLVCERIAEKHGVTCHRSAVGEINVVKVMQANHAKIGGEGNGGVINGDLHHGRDALVGMAMILQLLAEKQQSSASYRAEQPNFFMAKQKLQLDKLGIDADELLAKAEKHFSNEQINTVDGLKINYPNSWVHLRKSNIEPIVRVYTEAEDLKAAEKLAETTKEILANLS
jgi:phosphomannomutase